MEASVRSLLFVVTLLTSGGIAFAVLGAWLAPGTRQGRWALTGAVCWVVPALAGAAYAGGHRFGDLLLVALAGSAPSMIGSGLLLWMTRSAQRPRRQQALAAAAIAILFSLIGVLILMPLSNWAVGRRI